MLDASPLFIPLLSIAFQNIHLPQNSTAPYSQNPSKCLLSSKLVPNDRQATGTPGARKTACDWLGMDVVWKTDRERGKTCTGCLLMIRKSKDGLYGRGKRVGVTVRKRWHAHLYHQTCLRFMAGLAEARNTMVRSAVEIRGERVHPTTAQLTDTVHRYLQSEVRKAHLSETPNTCCDHFARSLSTLQFPTWTIGWTVV